MDAHEKAIFSPNYTSLWTRMTKWITIDCFVYWKRIHRNRRLQINSNRLISLNLQLFLSCREISYQKPSQVCRLFGIMQTNEGIVWPFGVASSTLAPPNCSIAWHFDYHRWNGCDTSSSQETPKKRHFLCNSNRLLRRDRFYSCLYKRVKSMVMTSWKLSCYCR